MGWTNRLEPVVFIVVFVQCLDLNKIDALDVNGLVGNWEEREKTREAVFSGNVLKTRMLDAVFNAKSFHARRTTTQRKQSTPNKL